MPGAANPLLDRVLHRRRLRRRARLAATCWVFFGGLHIAVWWAAFEQNRAGWPTGILGAAVWPLLFAATISFVVFAYYTGRWFLASSSPKNYDWLEPTPAVELLSADVDEDTEPTIIRRTRLAS
ncbi:MAG TPA: hypothetical protein VIP98_06715 [Microlunatus sp.]